MSKPGGMAYIPSGMNLEKIGQKRRKYPDFVMTIGTLGTSRLWIAAIKLLPGAISKACRPPETAHRGWLHRRKVVSEFRNEFDGFHESIG
jgi:hypothetical protein